MVFAPAMPAGEGPPPLLAMREGAAEDAIEDEDVEMPRSGLRGDRPDARRTG
jgi:hypothetical protein